MRMHKIMIVSATVSLHHIKVCVTFRIQEANVLVDVVVYEKVSHFKYTYFNIDLD